MKVFAQEKSKETTVKQFMRWVLHNEYFVILTTFSENIRERSKSMGNLDRAKDKY